jgi:hypothetical protein
LTRFGLHTSIRMVHDQPKRFTASTALEDQLAHGGSLNHSHRDESRDFTAGGFAKFRNHRALQTCTTKNCHPIHFNGVRLTTAGSIKGLLQGEAIQNAECVFLAQRLEPIPCNDFSAFRLHLIRHNFPICLAGVAPLNGHLDVHSIGQSFNHSQLRVRAAVGRRIHADIR